MKLTSKYMATHKKAGNARMQSSALLSVGMTWLLFCTVVMLLPTFDRVVEAAVPAKVCKFDAVPSADGIRRMAVIVGVSKYPKLRDKDLPGAKHDAEAFYKLLTKSNGFAFPKENVCLLLDRRAKTKRVVEAFEKQLIANAKEGDIAVFYFAGHGGQRKDLGDDEADGEDETMLLFDAKPQKSTHFVDDRLSLLIGRLLEKTKLVTVVMDSCNSATGIRDISSNKVRTRFYSGIEDEENYEDYENDTLGGTRDNTWVDSYEESIVHLSAASDGSASLEINGVGVFTEALIGALSMPGAGAFTYGQLQANLRPLVARKSGQIPYIYGVLSRTVFGGANAVPVSWLVTNVADGEVTLSGLPFSGFGVGAELRIYETMEKAVIGDPEVAKATIVLNESGGITGKGHVVNKLPSSQDIQAGDIAILLRPSQANTNIFVTLRISGDNLSVNADDISAITKVLERNKEGAHFITTVSEGGQFEIGKDAIGNYVILDLDNFIRWSSSPDSGRPPADQLIDRLRGFSIQAALLAVPGEGGLDFTDNETLKVRIEKASGSSSDCVKSKWMHAEQNALQPIPVCSSWRVVVSIDKDASPFKLVVGGFIASLDGGLAPLTRCGEAVRLEPGGRVWKSRRFKSTPPVNIEEQIVVIGTREENQLDWCSLLATTPGLNNRGPGDNPLLRAMKGYLSGQRIAEDEYGSELTWTRTIQRVMTVAGTKFTNGKLSDDIDQREYTVDGYNITPFLPDDTNSTLYQVLSKADDMVEGLGTDGYPYKQHSWNAVDDEANLSIGIDCSRAIWFAFTRAGLPYNNKDDSYLTTKDMVGDNSIMGDEFQKCDYVSDLRTGDILVFRDDTQGDGHVIMVIDPKSDQRVAWGSHGWDGNARKLPVQLNPDNGVEYQKIKYKPDWQRWDRATMELKACWRYKAFEKERLIARGNTGRISQKRSCDHKKCSIRN